MAFDRQTLSPSIGVGSNAPTIFNYFTEDDMTTVELVGYFNEVATELVTGDLIVTYNVPTHYHGFYAVNNNGTVITITKIIGA